VTPASIARLRLANQRLSMPLASPVEVVRWLVAVQAQDFPVAKWSLAQRASGANDASLDRAFSEGAILRTHVLRPTWHFVLPADLRWLVELTAPGINRRMAPYDRRLELDDAVYASSNALIAKALGRGGHRTRRELAAALQAGGIALDTQRLGHLMLRAEVDLVVCSGAPRGKQQTYALVEERVPRTRSLPREEALAELARRYFASHGPATVRDFGWWSGLASADARRGVESLGKRLEREVVGGRTYLFAAQVPGAGRSPRGLLLQGYDEYVIAYSESRDVFDPSGLSRSLARGRVSYPHAVVFDGEVKGRWRRSPGNVAVLEVALRERSSPELRRALLAEVGRYGRFVGARAELRLQALSARAPRRPR
jgi:hypothetical protein